MPKNGIDGLTNGSKPSSRIDPHSALAEKLYGEVTPTGRAKAKEINYMRAYSAGEIAVCRKAGQFPVTDFTALELRVLALFS